MIDKRTFVLSSPQDRSRAEAAVRAAPDGYCVTISEKMKSRPQEEKYHAQIGDIAKQVPLYGRKWHAESWKRLLIDQFRRDTEKDPAYIEAWQKVGPMQTVPSLDGEGVVMLGAQSRRFPAILASAFIEWLFAFGAEHDVQWTDPQIISQWREWNERQAA